MPVIIKLIPRRKGAWVEVFPDEGYPIKLPVDKLPATWGAGAAPTPDEWQTVSMDAQYFALLDRALNILGRREHFTMELKRKLQQRCRENEVVERVIAECLRMGYLDEQRALQALLRMIIGKGGVGERRLAYELRRRGCPNELITTAVADFNAQVSEVDEIGRFLASKRRTYAAKAQSLAKRLAGQELSESEREYQLRAKLGNTVLSALQRQGFVGAEARQAAKQLIIELLAELP